MNDELKAFQANTGYEPTDIDALPTYRQHAGNSGAANEAVQGDPELMRHVRHIADQLHEHGLLLQLLDGSFLVRDEEWVRKSLGIAITDASVEDADRV